MDNVVLKKISFAVLGATFGIATAWAGPPEAGRGGPNSPNDFRQAGSFSSVRPGAPPEQEYSQHHGKLSPDERRELRRQIDEAGQDIYRAKRR